MPPWSTVWTMNIQGGTRAGGLSIKGELIAQEDVTLDGTFEGSIDLKGYRLVTGAKSHINAAVSAGTVTVNGTLEGNITADTIDIRPGAFVSANLMTKQFALEDGARFNGSVNTERARAAATIAKHRTRVS